jgi:hypothetical protein
MELSFLRREKVLVAGDQPPFRQDIRSTKCLQKIGVVGESAVIHLLLYRNNQAAGASPRGAALKASFLHAGGASMRRKAARVGNI